MTDQSGNTNVPISLPQGGGAINGIGETFQPNLFSGTGNISIPIYTSPGRNGFGPQLTVQYSSGNGNGNFGLGWQHSIPRVTRKTEKGLPTYTDQDVFVMSGAEDLVPYLERAEDDSTEWKPVVTEHGEFTIALFRPRTESQFTRIERWTKSDGDMHWRAITNDNTTSIYGLSVSARVFNSQQPDEIYQWLLEETFDAKGNHILYEYIQESQNLNLPGIHERNRIQSQVYIRRILYGNTPDNLDASLKDGLIRTATDHANPLLSRSRHYVFEVLFDYGDLPEELSIPIEIEQHPEDKIPENWPVREDSFSSFRSGFEIRTLRRCRRVLMLHHFNEDELKNTPLVKSTDFEYRINPDTKLSCLNSVTLTGYRNNHNDPQQYLRKSMPPVTFTYSEFTPQAQRYQSVTASGGDFPPRSLGDPDFTVMDIFGNGMPDIMQDTGSGLHYWQNLGDGHLDHRRSQPGSKPAHTFSQAGVAIADLAGDGLADLLVDTPEISGFYESTPQGNWKEFKQFPTRPGFNLGDPDVRLVDLSGDGLTDLLISRDDHFLWYRSKGEDGYDIPRAIPRQHDLENFPDVYFSEPEGRVRLADMTGDGLSDIVLLHDGRIDYWPNLGYGKFGKRITMVNAPKIGSEFNPRRLFLADLDGSGVADLVYVEHSKVRFWFNQSGNAWSQQQTVKGTPYTDDTTSIQFVDFYGTGTTTLLWSYDFADHANSSNYKLLDFCGGNKPNLLIEMANNMGATTRFQYAASTKFYLQDKKNKKPWITSLPFPVQVVEKTETIDHIGKTRLITNYEYHHGYYDGREREFRGFGRVDQFDTEIFEDFNETSLHDNQIVFNNNKRSFHVAPVQTSTWFHTGIYFDPKRHLDHRELSEQYRNEYYQGDSQAFLLADHVITQVDQMQDSGDSLHEAYRTLRGAVLHSEVYAKDGSVNENHPYTVTDNRYQVQALQPKDFNNHSVFLTTQKESVNYHYERNPQDPRIGHTVTLGIDEFGNVTDAVSIGYPRRVVPAQIPEQGLTSIVYTHTDYINKFSPNTVTSASFYYAGIVCQTRSYEVTGIDWQPGQAQLDAGIFKSILDDSIEVNINNFKPHDWKREDSDTGIHKRLIEWSRNYFRTDDKPEMIDSVGHLDHRLALGEIESLALPYETYQTAFTISTLQNTFGDRIAGIEIVSEGGYHPHFNHPDSEGENGIENYIWIPSGRQSFNAEKFFLTEQAQDPFNNTTSTESDPYAFLTESYRDALPTPQTNVIQAKNNYRVLQPIEVTDPNGNQSQVVFDVLGMVVGTAVFGEDVQGNAVGDSLADFTAELSDATVEKHLTDPLNLDVSNDTNPHTILNGASTRLVYDLDRFSRIGEPNVVYTLTRETHVSDQSAQASKIQHGFVYSDGFGRVSQTKIQAEPDQTDPDQSRWLGTGTTIYNNKGNPVQQYEAFFSPHHHHAIEQHGISPTLFYDPLGRVVCTVLPNHTYEKVLFDPWQQNAWDSNDTLLLDPRVDPDIIQYVDDFFEQYDLDYINQHGHPPQTWFQEYSLSDDKIKRSTAQKTQSHADTPSVVYLDALGRAVMTVADNGKNTSGEQEKFITRVNMDIEGNQLEVMDALDRIVIRYDYAMQGNLLNQASMEAGERWMLTDVMGSPIYTWDSRGQRFRMSYDVLRRPSETFISKEGSAEIIIERMVYGESKTDPQQKNLRGKVIQIFDQAGIATTNSYDFKGNSLNSQRQLAEEYKSILDWSNSVSLETQIHKTSARYDALNRPIEMTAPDQSVIQPSYNEANLLETVETKLHGETQTTAFVTNIDYDEKGQRQRIDYGNGVSTKYKYDPLTFRLVNLQTKRNATNFPKDCPQPPASGFPGCQIQNLYYTHDPMGNISHVRDDAQQAIFFRNRRVEPSNEYSYDPTYRLIEASGREHLGQGSSAVPHSHDDAQQIGLQHPGDGAAMSVYLESFIYDAVGNILSMQHRGSDASRPGWKRDYNYNEASQIESGKFNNRLSSTKIGIDTQTYLYEGAAGIHGNITSLPHLSLIQWDFADQLRTTTRQRVNSAGTPESTWYVYDAGGQRVRKITERHAASGQISTRLKERIYLGGFEIYREYENDGVSISLERESLHIMDDTQRIALIETRTQGDDGSTQQLLRFQLSNHLGSANIELDDQAQIISYEEYTPYGSTSYQAVRGQTEAAKRYRYTGMERDEESGLNYHAARYYLPWLGRWLSIDPLFTDYLEKSPFNYGFNNPLNFVDLDGEEPKRIDVESFMIRAADDTATAAHTLNNLEKARGNLKIINDRVENWYRVNAQSGGGKTLQHAAPDLNNALSNLNEKVKNLEIKGVADNIKLQENLEYLESDEFKKALGDVGEHGNRGIGPRQTTQKNYTSLVKRTRSVQAGLPKEGRLSRIARKAKGVAKKAHGTFKRTPKPPKGPGSGFGSKSIPGGNSNVAIGAGIVLQQLMSGNYSGAAETTASTIGYMTPAAPIVFMKDVIKSYDSSVVEIANSAGTVVEDFTGSEIAGGLTASVVSVAVSIKRAIFGVGGAGSFATPRPEFNFIKETDFSVEIGPGNSSMIPPSRYPGKRIIYH